MLSLGESQVKGQCHEVKKKFVGRFYLLLRALSVDLPKETLRNTTFQSVYAISWIGKAVFPIDK